MVPCPNHGGAFDCTPFCSICEGNQEYEVKATGYEMPLDITEELLEVLEAENIEEALEELLARRGYDETKERRHNERVAY